MRLRSRFVALAFVAALLGLPSPARAADPRVPVLGGDARAEDKVEGFRRAHASDADLVAALDAAKGAEPRDRIHLALLADPAYRAAVEGFERTGDNVDQWRKLLEGLPKTARYHRAHAAYFLGRALLGRDELEAAAMAMELVRGRLRAGTPWTDEATLYLAGIYARVPEVDESRAAGNRERARQMLDALLPEEQGRKSLYPDLPERVAEGAVWLRRELRGEGSGPLLELAKRMETIERLIDRTRTDDPTQQKQKEVVVTIDKLIELMREKESGGG